MNPVDEGTLIEAQTRRYATKLFDRNRAIPDEVWASLEVALQSTPSSFNLQPWKFIVVTDEALKTELRKHAFNQPQLEDCSHYVVICARERFDQTWVERMVDRVSEIRGVSKDSLQGYRELVSRDLFVERKDLIHEIAIRQCFIALGNLVASAALLGLDTCAIEGFDPAKFDEVLGLNGSGWKSCISCAVGYRNAGDKYASLPKVRFPLEDVIERR